MIRFFVRVITRVILALRYKVEVKGLDAISRSEGVCFLPNHPSELDPVILLSLLSKKYRPHPIVVETVYEMPLINSLMKLVGSLPIPDFDLGGNDYTRLLAKRALLDIVNLLNRGENILLYPSGRLKRGPFEEVRGASGAFDIIKQANKVKIVLVRTEGLWGSLFSMARIESSKQVLWTLLKAFGILLQNLILFAPRRSIKVTFYEAPADFYTYSTKEGFNKALEEWYNAPFSKTGEPLKLVREAFWSKKIPEPLTKKSRDLPAHLDLPDDITKRVIAEIAYVSKRKAEDIQLEHSLSNDVGMDSLDIITLITFLEDEFAVRRVVPQDLDTVFDVVYTAAFHQVEHKGEELVETCGWPSLDKRQLPIFESGHTLIEVFLKNCERRPDEPACADLMTGRVFTYAKAKLIIVMLSRLFKKWPEKKVAVMMPATSMSYFVVLALMLAGKTPVMLNWTLGRTMLLHATQVTQVKRIITSRKFVRFAKTMDLEGVDDKLFFLEDLPISLFTKLKGWWRARSGTEALLKRAPPLTDESHAVILFTSGSENTPKAVPLTHKNILCNQRAAFSVVHFHKDDVLLGFLPPFHSFGFSVTGLLPLLSGLLVVFAPDPTDSLRLAESIDRWRISFLCGAPTFLRALLHCLPEGRAKSVRLIVTGAEKAPAALYTETQKKIGKADVIEGYGITECAPILTLNRPGEKPRGVGLPLPGVELAICNLAETELLGLKEVGIVLARGPNIFNGYLSHTASRPFITIADKKWYVTGDLGSLDEEGALWLAGRLKRFVKIGGEMVSLLALEEALAEGLSSGEGASLAVIAQEKDEMRPDLILFTVKNIGLDEANRVLREKKLSHLAKISRIVHLAEMPLLGTGKVNTRALEEKLHK